LISETEKKTTGESNLLRKNPVDGSDWSLTQADEKKERKKEEEQEEEQEQQQQDS